jgi:glycerol kinase
VILAIDQGTTATTCLVVDDDGLVLGRGSRPIEQRYPRPGWVEHDPEQLWSSVTESAADALAASGVSAADLRAIGITNQRETTVLWDRSSGRAVADAIVWQDRRTAAACAELPADLIRELTGLVPDPYFSATKLAWLLEHAVDSPEGLAFGTVDSWLIWKLTGGEVHATDPTNASRTMLCSLRTLRWDDRLLELFGVPADLLPEIRPSSGMFGEARLLGARLPVMGVAGDQQAALFGQGCWSAGTSKNTYGTGAFLLLNTGAKRPVGGGGMLTTIACDATGAPAYALEASIFIAGAAVQWLRDGLGIIGRAGETEAMARTLASNDGVYFVPALTGLGAPEWEPRARGTIVGLTRGTTREHVARAALEAMCFSTADVLGAMRQASGAEIGVLRVDGGATENGWMMQFQADLLGVPVERPDVVDTTAMGAGALAGIAAGVWPNAEAFIESRKYTRFTPGDGRHGAQAALSGWHRAVRATVAWARDGGA